MFRYRCPKGDNELRKCYLSQTAGGNGPDRDGSSTGMKRSSTTDGRWGIRRGREKEVIDGEDPGGAQDDPFVDGVVVDGRGGGDPSRGIARSMHVGPTQQLSPGASPRGFQ